MYEICGDKKQLFTAYLNIFFRFFLKPGELGGEGMWMRQYLWGKGDSNKGMFGVVVMVVVVVVDIFNKL